MVELAGMWTGIYSVRLHLVRFQPIQRAYSRLPLACELLRVFRQAHETLVGRRTCMMERSDWQCASLMPGKLGQHWR